MKTIDPHRTCPSCGKRMMESFFQPSWKGGGFYQVHCTNPDCKADHQTLSPDQFQVRFTEVSKS